MLVFALLEVKTVTHSFPLSVQVVGHKFVEHADSTKRPSNWTPLGKQQKIT